MLPLFDNIPVRRIPIVTWGLIAANFAVWFWELGARNARIDHYAFYPCAVSGPCLGYVHHVPWAEGVFTSMFMHASWLHILGNMLFLFIFGNNIEDVLGRLRFLVFYVAGGYVAALGQAYVTLHWAGTQAASIPNIGASGAIAAVLGAYIIILPRARVVSLLGIFPIPVPAVLFLGLWFVLQLVQTNFSMTHPTSGGGTAFAAHVSGFVFGAVAVRVLQVRAPLGPRGRR